MDLGFDVVVTITGIVLVFLILILLMAIITLEGKIFDSMNAKKKAAKEAAKAFEAAAKAKGEGVAAPTGVKLIKFTFTTCQFIRGSPPKKSTSRFTLLPELATRKSRAFFPTSKLISARSP